VLADGVLVWKKSVCERFVDDGNVWGSGYVAFVNGASSQQARADCLEIMRTNSVPGGRRPTIVSWLSLNEHGFICVVTGQRAVPGQACAQDAGCLRHRLLKSLIKSVQLVWRVAGQPRSDLHDQATLRHKAEMLVFEIA